MSPVAVREGTVQEQNGKGAKGLPEGEDEDEAREDESGGDGEDAGVPELLRGDVGKAGGALGEKEREDEAEGGECAEGWGG